MRDFISQVFDSLNFSPDDASGSVQNIDVPAPSEADVDELGGDEDDEGDKGDEEDKDEETDEAESGEEEERVEEKDEDEKEETDEEKAARLVKEKADKEEEEKETPENKIPSIKAIRKEYPDFFKKFPHVRAAIAEHQQFRSIFDSAADAREASEHQQNFMEISSSLFKGDFGNLLDEMEKAEKESVPRLVKKILPTLLEKNRDLYMDATEPAIKLFIKAAHDRGNSEGNKNLANAALHLAQFLTGKAEVPHVEDFRPDPRDAEFNKKISDFETAKLNDATKQVDDSIGTQLSSLVEKAIDPNNVMKDLTKKALVRQVISDIVEETAKDEAHHARMQRLWGNAKRSSYASGHISRIITASLERAKQVLPNYARKVREEHGIKVNNGEKPKQLVTRPVGGSSPNPKTIRETNPRKIDWSKTSDEDVLSGKAVLKR